jgi:hypothetical protein
VTCRFAANQRPGMIRLVALPLTYLIVTRLVAGGSCSHGQRRRRTSRSSCSATSRYSAGRPRDLECTGRTDHFNLWVPDTQPTAMTCRFAASHGRA